MKKVGVFEKNFNYIFYDLKCFLKYQFCVDKILWVWYYILGTFVPVEHHLRWRLLPIQQRGANFSFSPFNFMEGGGNHVHHINRTVNAFDLDYRSRRIF